MPFLPFARNWNIYTAFFHDCQSVPSMGQPFAVELYSCENLPCVQPDRKALIAALIPDGFLPPSCSKNFEVSWCSLGILAKSFLFSKISASSSSHIDFSGSGDSFMPEGAPASDLYLIRFCNRNERFFFNPDLCIMKLQIVSETGKAS